MALLFTLDDFQLLGKYDPSVNYGQIPESERANSPRSAVESGIFSRR
jgi:hypothetical protein